MYGVGFKRTFVRRFSVGKGPMSGILSYLNIQKKDDTFSGSRQKWKYILPLLLHSSLLDQKGGKIEVMARNRECFVQNMLIYDSCEATSSELKSKVNSIEYYFLM